MNARVLVWQRMLMRYCHCLPLKPEGRLAQMSPCNTQRLSSLYRRRPLPFFFAWCFSCGLVCSEDEACGACLLACKRPLNCGLKHQLEWYIASPNSVNGINLLPTQRTEHACLPPKSCSSSCISRFSLRFAAFQTACYEQVLSKPSESTAEPGANNRQSPHSKLPSFFAG